MAMVFRAKVSRRLRRQNCREPEGEEADSAISQMRLLATASVENGQEYGKNLASQKHGWSTELMAQSQGQRTTNLMEKHSKNIDFSIKHCER